jgi:hypothetical protein
MRVFLTCCREREEVKVLARLPDGLGPVEKVTVRLAAGMSWQGYTYEDLMRLGTGSHDLQLPRPISPKPVARPRNRLRRKKA